MAQHSRMKKQYNQVESIAHTQPAKRKL